MNAILLPHLLNATISVFNNSDIEMDQVTATVLADKDNDGGMFNVTLTDDPGVDGNHCRSGSTIEAIALIAMADVLLIFGSNHKHNHNNNNSHNNLHDLNSNVNQNYNLHDSSNEYNNPSEYTNYYSSLVSVGDSNMALVRGDSDPNTDVEDGDNPDGKRLEVKQSLTMNTNTHTNIYYDNTQSGNTSGSNEPTSHRSSKKRPSATVPQLINVNALSTQVEFVCFF